MAAAAAGLLACVVTVALFRDALTARDRFFPGAAFKVSLPFTYADDYQSVVARLGAPSQSRALTIADGREFVLLRYPGKGVAVVLENSHYLGAVTRSGRVAHSVVLPGGQDSAATLRALKP